jgi:hypothetical protein
MITGEWVLGKSRLDDFFGRKKKLDHPGYDLV